MFFADCFYLIELFWISIYSKESTEVTSACEFITLYFFEGGGAIYDKIHWPHHYNSHFSATQRQVIFLWKL